MSTKGENLQFGKQLVEILNIYTENEFENEPLDSDEVADLVVIVNAQLELLNGNITEYQYNKMLDKDNTTFILCPVSTLNDSRVSFLLVRVNDEVRNKLKEFRTILKLTGQSSLVFNNLLIDQNTTLITNDLGFTSTEQKTLVEQLQERFDEEIVMDVSDIIDNEKFDLLHNDTKVNWNENTKIDVSLSGKETVVYITNQFETDYIESWSIDFSEMEIFD